LIALCDEQLQFMILFTYKHSSGNINLLDKRRKNGNASFYSTVLTVYLHCTYLESTG